MESQEGKAEEVKRRRVLRASLKELTNNTISKKAILSDLKQTQLSKFIDKAEVLGTQVEKPREHAVDSELFWHLTNCGLAASNQLVQDGQVRSVPDFVSALRTNYARGGLDDDRQQLAVSFSWQRLGKGVCAAFHDAPGVSSMMGPLDAVPKERKAPAARQQRQRQTQEVQRAQDLGTEEAVNEKQETDRNMEDMWKQIQARTPAVPLAELICNHQSFAQTVENLFTASFLVRDKKIRLSHNPSLGIMVSVVKTSTDVPGAEELPSQFVFPFQMDDWDAMKQLVRPEDCVMPHREGDGGGSRNVRKARPSDPVAARRPPRVKPEPSSHH